jgi:hypothetical protein
VNYRNFLVPWPKLTTFKVANWYNSDTLTASPSQINFLIFVPLWSFITIAYLEITPVYAKRGKCHNLLSPSLKTTLTTGRFTASHPYAHFTLEIITTIFYFAGAVALAVFLSKLLYCRGSVCASARAAAILSSISFVTWVVTTTLLGAEIFKGGFRAAQATNAMIEKTKETA